MAVEVYVGQRFRHTHERKALARFLSRMFEVYGDSDELFAVAIESEVNAAAIDLLLLNSHSINIADLKEIPGSEGNFATVYGTENGPWTYKLPDGHRGDIGHGRDRNPYNQIEAFRWAVRDWLVAHSAGMPRSLQNDDTALDHIHGWVVFSPGVNIKQSRLDLPWEKRYTKEWFKILSIDALAGEFGCTVDANFALSDKQMRLLLQELGVTLSKNPAEFVPDYVHPAPLFSPPPAQVSLVNRRAEREQLTSFLNNPAMVVCDLVGMGRIGKTTLASWLVNEARCQDHRILWLDCNDKRNITVDTILAAISESAPFGPKSLIRNLEQSLSDRMDVALECLASCKTLFVLDDFHLIAKQKGIDDFLTRAFRHAGKLHIILTARERADHPYWPIGLYQDIAVGGLDIGVIPELVNASGSQVKLTEQQTRIIWQKTEGNPGLIVLSKGLIREHLWLDDLENLPIADDLIGSLVSTLGEDARRLAQAISVIRSPISMPLIVKLSNEAPTKTTRLVSELADKYFLQELERRGTFVLDTIIREYLYNQMSDNSRSAAHNAAGDQLATMAGESKDDLQETEFLIEAIDHWSRGGSASRVLKRAALVYDRLTDLGDTDRAMDIAAKALHAAQTVNDAQSTCVWLIRLVDRELFAVQYASAESHIQQALSLLPKDKVRASEDQSRRWNDLESQVDTLKGRYAYYVTQFDEAVRWFEKALAYARQAADRALEGDLLIWLARVERMRKQNDSAQQHLQAARRIGDELRSTQLYIDCLSYLGLIAREQQHYDEAEAQFNEVYQTSLRVGNQMSAQITLSHLGSIHLRKREYDKAEEHFREALKVAESLHNLRGVRIQLVQLTETLIRRGKTVEAEQTLHRAEQLNRDTNDAIGLAVNLKHAGMLAKLRGDKACGNDLIRQGIAKLKEVHGDVYIKEFQEALDA